MLSFRLKIFIALITITTSKPQILCAQDSSYLSRKHLAYQYLYDSIANKLDIGWLVNTPLELHDSFFLPCDSTPVFTKWHFDSLGKFQEIYSDTAFSYYHNFDNYIYQSVDSNECKEYMLYKQKIADEKWDLTKFRNKPIPQWWDSTNCDLMCCCSAELSIPIFNRDYTKFVFSCASWCGPLCGYGFTCVYSFSNGKWIEEKRLQTMVS